MPFVTDNNSGRMRLDLVRKRCSFFLSFLPGFHFQPAPPPVTLRLRALGLTWRGRWAAFPDQLDSVCLDQFRLHLPVIAEKCAYPDRMVLGHTPSSRLERYQLFTRQRGHFNKSLGAEEGRANGTGTTQLSKMTPDNLHDNGSKAQGKHVSGGMPHLPQETRSSVLFLGTNKAHQ